jgi:hypothetical protein
MTKLFFKGQEVINVAITLKTIVSSIDDVPGGPHTGRIVVDLDDNQKGRVILVWDQKEDTHYRHASDWEQDREDTRIDVSLHDEFLDIAIIDDEDHLVGNTLINRDQIDYIEVNNV